MRDKILNEIFKRAGSQTELARKLGVTRQYVHGWIHVPPDMIIPIEKATGVAREKIRPEFYPKRRWDHGN